jgi:hypothetical protein
VELRSQPGGITRDDWLKALIGAGIDDTADDQDAVTVQEFQKLMGYPNEWAAKRRLQALVVAGRATETKKWGVDSRGRRNQFRAFRLK